MITIANPERWANVRAVRLCDLIHNRGHLIAVVNEDVTCWGNNAQVAQSVAHAIIADTVDEQLVKSRDDVDRLEAELRQQRDEVHDAKRELQTITTDRDRLKRDFDGTAADWSAALAARDEFRARLALMENELAKVRSHFGAKAYAEALKP